MGLNVQLLRDSFALVVEREPEVTHLFYDVLFRRFPQARGLFGRRTQREQEIMLRDMLVAIIDHLEDASWLGGQLGALGQKHVGYGVTPEMYGWVGAALLETLETIAGADWTPALASAWTEAYAAISSLMQGGVQPSVG